MIGMSSHNGGGIDIVETKKKCQKKSQTMELKRLGERSHMFFKFDD
jgi:hypothetical protein